MDVHAPPARAPRRFEGANPARLRRFPQRARTRWLLRLGIAAPFAAIAILVSLSPEQASLTTPNAALVASIERVDLDSGARELGVLYPPLTTIAAMLLLQLPFGSASLGVAGALVAGVFVHRLLELMHRRGLRVYGRISYVVALVATPLFAYLATTDLAGIVALWLFSLGLSDLVRFVWYGNTQAGFRAGLLLAGAALSSPMGIVYVLIAVLFVPLVRATWQGARARVANMVVVAFPTLGAFGAAMLLAWAFAGSPLAIVPRTVGYDAPRLDALLALLSTPSGAAILAPLGAAVLGAIVIRRAAVIPLAALLVLSVLVGHVLHLLPDGTAGVIYVLTLAVTIAIVPAAQSHARAIGIAIVALAQIPFGWIDALHRPSVRAWLDAIMEVLA